LGDVATGVVAGGSGGVDAISIDGERIRAKQIVKIYLQIVL
jgi:hypothetical protein